MQRFYKFIVVCLLLGVNSLTSAAQTGVSLPLLKSTLVTGKTIELPSLKPIVSKAALTPATLFREPSRSLSPLRPDYYVQSLGFFCQVEYRVEKKINVPLRFRIGALDYLNKLEGKK